MIYIAGQPTAISGQTTAFIERKLEGMTVGKVGEVGIYAIPREQQVAYTEYKTNIEAFVTATALGEKVLCNNSGYPFPADYVASVPIAIPATVIRFKVAPPPDKLAKILEEGAPLGMEKVTSKDGNSYIVRRPTAQFLRKLEKVCTERAQNMTSFSQMFATICMLPLIQFIDAFLATNTYSYKKADFKFKEGMTKAVNLDLRIEEAYYREGYSKDLPGAASVKESAPKRRKISDDEVEDLTPWQSSSVPHSIVAVAKPSLNPSSASWGLPSQVPNKGGLVFPYFKGMLQADVPFVRRITMSRFLRLFGAAPADMLASWKALRDSIGISMTTPEGIVISHILMGIDLCLQSQTQVFLLFDNAIYLGFVLLGDEFSVFYRGVFHAPLKAKDLRTELQKMYTHDGALDELVAVFGKCTFKGDSKMVMKDDIMTPEGLLDMLAELDVEDEDEPTTEVTLIRELLKRLNFRGSYRSFKPVDIEWAISMILLSPDERLGDQLLFVPQKGWSGVGDRVFQILSAFGPHSFSFYDPAGDIVRVPKVDTDEDFFALKDDKGKQKNSRFVVYEKNLVTAERDWNRVVKEGVLRMKFRERAAGSRAQVYIAEQMDGVWGILKRVAAAGLIGIGGEDKKKDEGGNKKGKKKGDTVDPSDVDFSAW
jgi:hypothetical protein